MKAWRCKIHQDTSRYIKIQQDTAMRCDAAMLSSCSFQSILAVCKEVRVFHELTFYVYMSILLCLSTNNAQALGLGHHMPWPCKLRHTETAHSRLLFGQLCPFSCYGSLMVAQGSYIAQCPRHHPCTALRALCSPNEFAFWISIDNLENLYRFLATLPYQAHVFVGFTNWVIGLTCCWVGSLLLLGRWHCKPSPLTLQFL